MPAFSDVVINWVSALCQSAILLLSILLCSCMLLSRSAVCMLLLSAAGLQQVRCTSSTKVPQNLWWTHCAENRKCWHYFQTGVCMSRALVTADFAVVLWSQILKQLLLFVVLKHG